jgi:DNA-binding protein YbaB
MTTVPPGAGAEALERVAEQQRRFAALRARAEGAQARLADNQAVVSSPDGAVTVTVNAGGQLLQLRLGAKADGRGSAALTELIMTTYRRACAQATARTVDILADISGENSATVRGLLAALPADVAGQVDEIRREEGRN